MNDVAFRRVAFALRELLYGWLLEVDSIPVGSGRSQYATYDALYRSIFRRHVEGTAQMLRQLRTKQRKLKQVSGLISLPGLPVAQWFTYNKLLRAIRKQT